MLELANDRFSLLLDPELGGSVANFRSADGQEIFRNARPARNPDATMSACFPMVPFCNRVRDRRFDFEGRSIVLEPNTRDQLRTAHGFGWRSEWIVERLSKASAKMRHAHAADCWPWHYEADQVFTLDTTGLTMQLTLRNTSMTRMPAGLGFHPYLPLHADTLLGFASTEIFALDDDGFPVSCVDGQTELKRAASGTLGAAVGNRYFSGRTGSMSISSRTAGRKLELTPSGPCGFLALHVEPDDGLFCLEPMTHQVGALNRLSSDDAAIDSLPPGAMMTIGLRCEILAF